MPVQKVTIVSRGQALGYTLNTPQEDRYLHTKEEFLDLMKVMLGGRAAEQIVFGAVTNGAANDLERVTALARRMVFEFGMGDEVASRTMRADNYALSEHTKQRRDEEQARLTDHAYSARPSACSRSTARRSTCSPESCSRRRRCCAASCRSSSAGSRPSRTPRRRSGCPRPSRCRPACPTDPR